MSKVRFTYNDLVEVRFRGQGRVLFIGQLRHLNDDSIWYGIKLNKKKGNHDGRIGEHKYFKCKSQHGIHVRVGHLKPIIEHNHNSLTQNKYTQSATGADRFLQESTDFDVKSNKNVLKKKRSTKVYKYNILIYLCN